MLSLGRDTSSANVSSLGLHNACMYKHFSLVCAGVCCWVSGKYSELLLPSFLALPCWKNRNLYHYVRHNSYLEYHLYAVSNTTTYTLILLTNLSACISLFPVMDDREIIHILSLKKMITPIAKTLSKNGLVDLSDIWKCWNFQRIVCVHNISCVS